MADVLEFGGGRPRGPRRPPRWLPLPLILAVAVAAAVIVHVRQGANDRAAPRPAPSFALTPDPPPPSPSAQPSPSITTWQGSRLLGITSGWELFARGDETVVRIEFARGRITRTAIPPLSSSGPVSFLAGPDWAMVRPLDAVPGYLVPDRQGARELVGNLSLGGPVLPGPQPGTVWVTRGDTGRLLILAHADGRDTPVAFELPAGMDSFPQPDGAGYALVAGIGGTYDVRPGRVDRVTTGSVVATGPTGWLALECDARYRCGYVLVDRATGARRGLATGPLGTGTFGVLSPDGRTAALLDTDEAGPSTVHLLDLTTGDDRRLDVPVQNPTDQGSLAWSPESRWLFVVGSGGRLYPVDVRTGRVPDLPAQPLPPVRQLAVRGTPG